MKDQSFACRRFSNGFFKVQREHLKGLCPRQRHLLMDLLSWADPDTGELETHLDEITEAIDCSKSSAHYVLKALEAKGFIAFSTKTGHHGFVKVRLLKNVSNKDRTKENETCAYGEKDKSALENEALNISRTKDENADSKKKERNKKREGKKNARESALPLEQANATVVTWTPEQRLVASEWALASRGLTETYGRRTIDTYASEIAFLVNSKAVRFEEIQEVSRWLKDRLPKIKPEKDRTFWATQLISPRDLLKTWKSDKKTNNLARVQTLMRQDKDWQSYLRSFEEAPDQDLGEVPYL